MAELSNLGSRETPKPLLHGIGNLKHLGLPFLGKLTNPQDLQTVSYLDLERFMGAWRVQGHTPLFVDEDSSNQVETYILKPDGSIDVCYEFRRFGREMSIHSQAQVANHDSNAHWKITFYHVFPADYLVVHLADDYSHCVVSVPNKEMIWIMSRDVKMKDSLYNDIIATLKSDSYPIERIRRVPQGH